jgi:hypothetical protein
LGALSVNDQIDKLLSAAGATLTTSALFVASKRMVSAVVVGVFSFLLKANVVKV